jgi:hypothetical protein
MLQKLYKCMSFRLRRIYLKIPQSKSHKRNFLKKVVNGHWLTKLKQDTKDKLTSRKTKQAYDSYTYTDVVNLDQCDMYNIM